ncbi:MAG: hypothetical protein PHR24_02030 [Oscillospiraceae bacterium]|nr:hypothetical protein [Oscillospiraceae bacterium]MDD3832861.1 hypothetical protein [Oscillospiraceae bacterium]MDD4546059.1 hypothetical protein [Oscillospiraceae bacterium]
MGENKPTPDQINEILEYASKKLGITKEQLASTVESDAAKKAASRLSQADIARFQSMVSDKDKLEKLLNSAQAKQLMEKLIDKKKD